MKKIRFSLIIFFVFQQIFSQSINLNQSYLEDEIRDLQILNKLKNKSSLSIRPINIDYEIDSLMNFNLFKKDNKISILPIDLISEFNSHLPYNRNNGIMIPNRGIQTVFSPGIYLNFNFLEVQFKPEILLSENLYFDGFWDGHYPVIISKRQNYWNHIDNPERFGNDFYNEFSIGQSFIKLNFKDISIGLSNENLWWGPSIRNSIMLSNNAIGFNHLTLNSKKPISTPIGNFEFQLVTGKLIGSEFTQSYNEFEYAGSLTYVEKNKDWRYFQGINIVYSPKFIDGFSIGFIRWVQAYSKFIETNKDYFPVFDNLLRNKDKYGYNTGTLEGLRDQAAGINFRWIWKDSKAEIYAEYYRNDSAANLRDLLLDSDHSRAATIGLQKIFDVKKDSYYKFSWEWTQMEQSNSKLLRNWGSDISIVVISWYHHDAITHGFTNRGEVLGASIGPGSNSHYFSLSHNNNNRTLGLSFEIVDQNNDFLYYAFHNAKDFRRYWKDFNLELSFRKKIRNYWIDIKSIYTKSLNYQWALDESNAGQGYDYYIPGIDRNNFHLKFRLLIPLNF